MKTLLLIPSVLKTDTATPVAESGNPRMDYRALADSLCMQGTADLVGYAQVDAAAQPLLRLTRRVAGRDAALALWGFLHRKQYDAIFTNGENIGIPLALLLKMVRRRPGHVTIGHRLSTGKKRLFFTMFRAHEQMDTIFVYAKTQYEFAQTQLGIRAENLRLIPFHADQKFYCPQPATQVQDTRISAAGLEWRDYPTLIAAVRDMPELEVKLAAASPWSKHTNETEGRVLPPNVDARRYDYPALRDLYASSSFVVVPLYENDFQAGVTTLLEAMAMGKAVIVTRTTGQTDVVTDGENGLTVAPGDVEGWKQAIQGLRDDTAQRERLGANGRKWVEQNATLDGWVENIAKALRRCAAPEAAKQDSTSPLRNAPL